MRKYRHRLRQHQYLETLYQEYIFPQRSFPVTYDHRKVKTGHPVRSGVLKYSTGCVVVGWVTTSEFQLLYVPYFCFFSWLDFHSWLFLTFCYHEVTAVGESAVRILLRLMLYDSTDCRARIF